LTSTDAQGHRRLDDPKDFVRLEILTALERGILIIPVLIDRATMPRSTELPAVLQSLAHCQAFMVADHFGRDVDRLIRELEAVPVSAGMEELTCDYCNSKVRYGQRVCLGC
jgi:hypothetical protein